MKGRAALALLLALAPIPALGHGLLAEVRLEGGEVVLELFFSDGAPSGDAEVTVTRAGAMVARGATDAGGVYRFRPDAPGRYRLEATEPGLHRANAEVEVTGDLLAAAPVTSAALAAPTRPGPGPPWGRAALGVLIIAALAGGLAATQRGRTREP